MKVEVQAHIQQRPSAHTVFISSAFLHSRFPVIASSAFLARLDALWTLTSQGQPLNQDDGHVESESHSL